MRGETISGAVDQVKNDPRMTVKASKGSADTRLALRAGMRGHVWPSTLLLDTMTFFGNDGCVVVTSYSPSNLIFRRNCEDGSDGRLHVLLTKFLGLERKILNIQYQL